VVHRTRLDAGALIQNERTGIFAQINAGVVRSLPQRDIARLVAND